MLPPPSDDNRVADLTRRVENLESALRAAFTTISGGRGLTIKDGGTLRILFPDDEGGGVGVYTGRQVSAVTGAYIGTGLLVQDFDGTDIAVFRSDVSGHPIAIIRDGQQNAVLFTDTVAGLGFGRPWFPGVFYSARNNDWPTTTSATFETLFRARISKQNPKLLVRVWGANTDTGATGEIRVMVNDVQLGATATTAAGVVAEKLFFDTVAGAFGAGLTVEIQARLASGTGQVQVCPSDSLGRN